MLNTVLKQIYRVMPLLKKVDQTYGNLTLSEYLSSIKHIPCGSIENRDDLISAVEDYLSFFLNTEITSQAIRTLKRTDFLLTANHHQIDFSLNMIHGNLLYEYLLDKHGKADQAVIPVISSGAIPMTNNTYPKGLILYDTRTDGEIRIPVIPNKYKHCPAVQMEPFNNEMVLRAQMHVKKHYRKGNLNAEESAAALQILDKVYGDHTVQNQDSYSKQVTYANIILSEKYYSDRQSRHVYIPMEEISRRLIIKDLNNEHSLLYRLFWDKKALRKLLKELDGVTGCWSRNGGGTELFWGIDVKGRIIHLHFNQDLTSLHGVDFDGIPYIYNYSPDTIIEYLRKNRLIPGLFITFTTMGFARDYSMLGGCFQSIYLEQMLQGIIETIADDKQFEREMDVLQKKRFYFLSALVTDMYIKEQRAVPAGAVEMWAEPARYADFDNRLRLTVKQAIELAAVVLYTKKITVNRREKDWYQLILNDLYNKWKNSEYLSVRKDG